MKAVPVAEGENIVELPVTDDWGAGVYVTASVLRPMDVAAGRNPSRALGLAYASIDPGDRQLAAAIEAPAEAAPRGPLPSRSRSTESGPARRHSSPWPPSISASSTLPVTPPRSFGSLLRPAQAGHRHPRHLRPPDRRAERSRGLDPLGRRCRGASATSGAAAHRGLARLLHRPGGRRSRRLLPEPASTCPPSTARCGSWPSPGRRPASGRRRPMSSCGIPSWSRPACALLGAGR